MRRALNIVTTLLVVTAGAILLDAEPRAIWLAFWGTALAAEALFLLVRWHARTTAYRCAKCAGEFGIEPLTDFISPHFFDRKYLRCPECGEKTWAKEINESGNRNAG
jgi:DNA-directed RNA polymerase subunit RPC12/RpoP